MNDKKGERMVGETVVEVLIAIIVISAILYFVYVLFDLFALENKAEQADSTLQEFVNTLEELKDREVKVTSFTFLNPKGWVIVFPFTPRTGKFVSPPEVCGRKRCVCICEDDSCNLALSCNHFDEPILDLDGRAAYFEILGSGTEFSIRYNEQTKEFVLGEN